MYENFLITIINFTIATIVSTNGKYYFITPNNVLRLYCYDYQIDQIFASYEVIGEVRAIQWGRN